MRIKLAILAVAVGTVAATTATAALASPGGSPHPVSTPTASAQDISAPAAPTQVTPPGYAKPVQVEPTKATMPGYAKPTQTTPAQIAPAQAPMAGYGTPATTEHDGKPVHVKVKTLTAADTGKTVRVDRGEQIRVKLAVKLKQNPDATTWWQAVVESGSALQPLPQTLMARRGVTLARYSAVAKGTATLSSSRAVCPTKADAAVCHSMQGWQVTIDVR